MNKQEIEKAISQLRDDIDTVTCVYKDTTLGKSKEHFTKCYSTAISALEEQLNYGWIPTETNSDNPLVGGEYQVTVRYENFAGIYEMAGVASYDGREWTIHGKQPVIANKKVIAWKPLDKPYKEVP